ncbi:MAG: PDZ domain-containing protein [Planctomycetota bacterium]|jgi:S1-C subfamily serine protease
MADSVKHTFTGFLSQLVVVCLLAVFILLVLVAMYTTSSGATEMSWIGMTVEPLGAETAAALGIPGNAGGVIVGEVEGMAARAGIRHGDVVQRINGQLVQDMAGFVGLTKRTELSKGGVQVVVNRRGIQTPVFVYPAGGAAPALGQAAPGGGGQALAGIDRRWLGIEAETLAAGEARGLGIPAGVAGVLVDTVAKGSKAQQAGLVNNDVIVSVNGKRTDSTVRLWGILGGLGVGDPVELSVYRNGQLKFISLPTASGTLAGGFPGRMGGQGLGPGGMLACPQCGTKVIHQRGVACNTVPCPACGTQMVRAQ